MGGCFSKPKPGNSSLLASLLPPPASCHLPPPPPPAASKVGQAGRLQAPNVNALQAGGGEGPGVFWPPSRDSHSLFGALGAGSRNSS